MESNDSKTIILEAGTAWFQLVPVKIHVGALERVKVLDVTARGSGGFGSTLPGGGVTTVTVPSGDEGMAEERSAAVADVSTQQLE